MSTEKADIYSSMRCLYRTILVVMGEFPWMAWNRLRNISQRPSKFMKHMILPTNLIWNEKFSWSETTECMNIFMGYHLSQMRVHVMSQKRNRRNLYKAHLLISLVILIDIFRPGFFFHYEHTGLHLRMEFHQGFTINILHLWVLLISFKVLNIDVDI